MSTTDHTSDPMGDDLDELLDAALDAAAEMDVVEWVEFEVAARQEAAEARRKARAGRKLERRWARVSAGIEVAMWEADLSYSAATRVAEAMDRLYYPEAWK